MERMNEAAKALFAAALGREPVFSDLKGLTITSIHGLHVGCDEVFITVFPGIEFIMHHQQDCCESVSVEEIIGHAPDLIGTPILMAEERSSVVAEDQDGETCTWTFYKLATVRGYVTIRWLGSSNGYYSERVDFEYR